MKLTCEIFIIISCFGAKNAQNQRFTSINSITFSEQVKPFWKQTTAQGSAVFGHDSSYFE